MHSLCVSPLHTNDSTPDVYWVQCDTHGPSLSSTFSCDVAKDFGSLVPWPVVEHSYGKINENTLNNRYSKQIIQCN
jgi:hypothetical protein